MYEIVYTVNNYYDGPKRGVADYQGKPHLYESEWDDVGDDYAETFLLTPIDEKTLALALDDWAIWRRWETAFHQGNATVETHPALPRDRDRHEQLVPLLKARLVIDPAMAVRARAEFRRRNDPSWNGIGWPPLEVRWEAHPRTHRY